MAALEAGVAPADDLGRSPAARGLLDQDEEPCGQPRPTFIGVDVEVVQLHAARRGDEASAADDPANGATVLSIESQVKSLSAAIFAPLLGLAVDWLRSFDQPDGKGASFIPVATAGLLITAAMLVFCRPPKRIKPSRTLGNDD